MIGVVPAITISRFLNQESIYTMQFKFWGDRIARGRNVEILEKMNINSVITDDYETIQESVPMLSIIDKFMNTKYSTFPVINTEDEIVGIISIRDIREVMFDEALHPLLIAHDFATRDIITLDDDSSFEDAFSKFDFGDFDSLPVVYKNTNKIKGIVLKEDLIKVYRKELLFSSHV